MQSRLFSRYKPTFRLRGMNHEKKNSGKLLHWPRFERGFPEYELQGTTFVLLCLASSSILRFALFWDLECQVATDVSVPLTGTIFKGQTQTNIQRCVKSQENADLIYTGSEA